MKLIATRFAWLEGLLCKNIEVVSTACPKKTEGFTIGKFIALLISLWYKKNKLC